MEPKMSEESISWQHSNTFNISRPPYISKTKKLSVALAIGALVVGVSVYSLGRFAYFHSTEYQFGTVYWYSGKCHPQEGELNTGFFASVLAWTMLNEEAAEAVEESLPQHPTPAECAAYKREIAAIRYIDRMGNTRNPAGDLILKGPYERRRERRLDR
jgi:hypothetical protein